MAKSIYVNLEDDVTKVINQLKRERSAEAVLVFPKRSFIFSDSINLRLLKKQIDLLGKKVSILTMDERGQMYAQEAGFELKHLPKSVRNNSFSDIRRRTAPVPETVALPVDEAEEEPPAFLRKKKKAPAVVFTSSRAETRSASKPTSSVTSKTLEPLMPARAKDNVFLPPSSKPHTAPRRKSYRAYVVGAIALVLIVILLLVLVVLPSANVVVYANTQSVARDIDIIADTKAQTTDSSKLTIPAVAVNESHTIAEDFQANGKKELGSKAEGRVALYNLTGSPMALKAATTTLTVGSKTYVFKTDQATVKPLTSAADDSTATVADIIATEGGEGYNIPAGTRMEVNNQAFGSQPQRLYAKTVSQVIGGNSRFVSVISQQDIADAQSKLIKKVVDGINSNLTNQKVKLVDGAYAVNIESLVSDKPEGTEAQNFRVELKVNISGLAFDETGLKNMIRQRLLSSLGAGKTLQELDQDRVIYQIKNLDVQSGLMQLALHYESNAKPNIEGTDLINKLAGKSKEEASDLILSNPDVDKVEITVQPAWQSDLPRFGSKIHLEVRE
jgi:hypothetical protein